MSEEQTIPPVAETPNPSPTETSPVTTSTEAAPDTKLLTAPEPAEEPKVEAPVVPEAYELKAPEGQTLSPDLIAEATPILKELGVTNEGAQKLVDLFNKQSASIVDKLYNDQRAVRAEWAGESTKFLEALPGGIKQAKVDLAAAKNALFTDPTGAPDTAKIARFNQFMDMTGAGDNPLFIEAFVKMGKQFIEGKAVTGKGPSAFGQKSPGAAPRSVAQSIYPNLGGQG